jgi:hypothetical protein
MNHVTLIADDLFKGAFTEEHNHEVAVFLRVIPTGDWIDADDQVTVVVCNG